jgi:TRAP-type C4-dicarboxylate transport system substrate-binding protein
VPTDIEGAEIRRTEAKATGTAIEQWGATPVSIPFTDAVEGMRTGVVDGLETGDAYGFTFGVADVSNQVGVNDWAADFVVHWASIDWLKGLSAEDRETFAEVTRTASEEVVRMVPDVVETRMGLVESPPDGSAAAEAGITVQMLSDDEKEQWRAPVDPQENRDLYADAIENGESLAAEGFLDYITETAQSSSVPSAENFELDSWWIDHLQDM